MKVIKVCIGSACHVKGSYDVLEKLKQLILVNKLEEELTIQAAFCLKNCTEAVSVQRWDGTLLSFSRENAEELFEKEIVGYLR